MTERKISDMQALKRQREQWRSQHQAVVFTNGCFDILHLGHVDYLERAALLGEKLVVGLNSDMSVRQLKGNGRPILDVAARSRILAALEFVDAVVLFDDLTPEKLISELLPDILVKGSDYERSNIVGADIVEQMGGRVETIELVTGYSTTQIIEKIKTH